MWNFELTVFELTVPDLYEDRDSIHNEIFFDNMFTLHAYAIADEFYSD